MIFLKLIIALILGSGVVAWLCTDNVTATKQTAQRTTLQGYINKQIKNNRNHGK